MRPETSEGVRGIGFNMPHLLDLPDATKSAAPGAPRVAILIDTATGWGRRLIYGVIAYSRKHGPWHLWIEPRGQAENLRPPRSWTGAGIIARVSTPAMARDLLKYKVPIVNVSGIQLQRSPKFPRVTIDVRAAGKLAANHFLDRGFRNFAYVGLLKFKYMQDYARGFTDTLEAAGHSAAIFSAPTTKSWSDVEAELAEWIQALPKPLAVFAWGLSGMTVLEACQRVRLEVPGEVAVLAGDEDDLLCETATPPLSGVETPSELVGHKAAAVLHKIMSGTKPPSEDLLIAPTRIVTRQSTDTLAIDDPDLESAMRFIHKNAANPAVDVPAVLKTLSISRRSLERRFEQVFGRTPAEELRRVRLQRARELLVQTDLPIPDVAASAGFASPEYLNYVFKAELGDTPQRFRSASRVR